MKKLFKFILVAVCALTFGQAGQAEAAFTPVQVADVGAAVFTQRYNALAPNGKIDVSIQLEPNGSNALYDSYMGFVGNDHAIVLFVNKAGYVSRFTIVGTDIPKLAGMYTCAMAGVGFSVEHNHNRLETLVQAVSGLQLNNTDERWSKFYAPELNRTFLMQKRYDAKVGQIIEVRAFANDGATS